MAYQNKYYKQGVDIIAERKAKNESLEKYRLATFIRDYPRYETLNNALMATGQRLAMLFFNGKPDVSAEIKRLEDESIAIQEEMNKMLKLANKPSDYLDSIYTCKICKDTGFFENKYCSCLEETVKLLASKELNASSPIRLCSFETFDLGYYSDTVEQALGVSSRDIMTENLRICKNYAEDFHIPDYGMLFTGGTGLGKTHLSLSIAKAVIEKGYSVVYGSAPDLLRKVEKEHFNRFSDEDTIETLINTDLLIIDDLGAEFDSQFYVSAIYNIINARMNKLIPTIISTNLNVNEMRQRYTDRIVSRLHSLPVLMFYGADIRLTKTNELTAR